MTASILPASQRDKTISQKTEAVALQSNNQIKVAILQKAVETPLPISPMGYTLPDSLGPVRTQRSLGVVEATERLDAGTLYELHMLRRHLRGAVYKACLYSQGTRLVCLTTLAPPASCMHHSRSCLDTSKLHSSQNGAMHPSPCLFLELPKPLGVLLWSRLRVRFNEALMHQFLLVLNLALKVRFCSSHDSYQ